MIKFARCVISLPWYDNLSDSMAKIAEESRREDPLVLFSVFGIEYMPPRWGRKYEIWLIVVLDYTEEFVELISIHLDRRSFDCERARCKLLVDAKNFPR